MTQERQARMAKQTMAKEAAEAKARDTKAAEAKAAQEVAERFARRSYGVGDMLYSICQHVTCVGHVTAWLPAFHMDARPSVYAKLYAHIGDPTTSKV